MKNINEIIALRMGAKGKKYRQEWNKAGRNNYIPKFPLSINFELNFGCNLKCDFCLHSISVHEWEYEVDVFKKISFSKYSDIIMEGVVNNLYSVEFNGINEPLLKKDICRYIRFAKENGILVTSLHTNGVLLTTDMAKDIINSGLNILIFSVDAIKKKTYEQLRKNGDYDVVLNNINNFLNLKKDMKKEFPLVQMSFNKNKFNYLELQEYTKYWENKVDAISTSDFCNPFIGGKKEQYIEDMYRLNKCNNRFICREPFQRLFIRSDGKVHPCCSFFGGEMIIGDIYTESIRDIWNSEKMDSVRKKVNVSLIERNLACCKCYFSLKGVDNDN